MQNSPVLNEIAQYAYHSGCHEIGQLEVLHEVKRELDGAIGVARASQKKLDIPNSYDSTKRGFNRPSLNGKMGVV
ncbi:MAG: hypothetical protein COA43_04685 [Robiginitomaculum sp.]|nr:MAG: hypothetical protein COA43_04685 [Robiginitomaculum sp.]